MRHCPACKSQQSRVKESRTVSSGRVFRRRECARCGERWNTWEVADFEGYAYETPWAFRFRPATPSAPKERD